MQFTEKCYHSNVRSIPRLYNRIFLGLRNIFDFKMGNKPTRVTIKNQDHSKMIIDILTVSE